MAENKAREVIEQFTFRNGDKSVTVDAVVDTGAESTQITLAMAAELQLQFLSNVSLSLADESRSIGHLYRCVVAWSIYESHGYFSVHDVVCAKGNSVLIGMDFLKQHELSVDIHNMGLVGHAPRNAEPITGGGYVLNAPKGWVRRMNGARANAAKPGDILRPHPAWRFIVPAIQKIVPDKAT